MDKVVKWCLKVTLTAVFWIFIFSITWNGRPLFSYANEFLVQNSVVRAIDQELGVFWHRVSETAVNAWETKKGTEEAF